MSADRPVVIVGGGHNGLVAAGYLARAGRRVTVLEKLDRVGGAAVSAEAFPGVEARLSRYSYLVSLLPQRIIRDLGLNVRLLRRRYSSFTPEPGTDRGLLIDNADPAATEASFSSIVAGADAAAWRSFYSGTARLARAVFPTLCEPLLTRSEARRAVGDDRLWDALLERPIGEELEARFASDLVRGVVLTDALIGTFASAHDPSLAANRCFLYHVIGGGTGDWDVPVGGMGAVSSSLAMAARRAGAELVTGAEVVAVEPPSGGAGGRVHYLKDEEEFALDAEVVLSGVAPAVLARLIRSAGGGAAADRAAVEAGAEGAQVKVNLMLDRLPRLKDPSIDPAAAFGGTFHINELYGQLQAAFETASAGDVPDPLPAEIYCHSLTDPSILSPELRRSGAHTLTVFGLHTPHRLAVAGDNEALRARLQSAVLASLDSVLAEPIAACIMTDGNGDPCIETKTTLDLEDALGLPGGNIFHGPLAWPFAEDDTRLDTPERRWGVESGCDGILLCGSGARRGGAVSGIGGHNAAMAVLEAG